MGFPLTGFRPWRPAHARIAVQGPADPLLKGLERLGLAILEGCLGHLAVEGQGLDQEGADFGLFRIDLGEDGGQVLLGQPAIADFISPLQLEGPSSTGGMTAGTAIHQDRLDPRGELAQRLSRQFDLRLGQRFRLLGGAVLGVRPRWGGLGRRA